MTQVILCSAVGDPGHCLLLCLNLQPSGDQCGQVLRHLPASSVSIFPSGSTAWWGSAWTGSTPSTSQFCKYFYLWIYSLVGISVDRFYVIYRPQSCKYFYLWIYTAWWGSVWTGSTPSTGQFCKHFSLLDLQPGGEQRGLVLRT